jgi:predicted metal-dependent HD superfamily phosphohydrolase
MNDLLPSWQRAWQAVGAQGDGMALYAQLLARYSEPQRKYHTVQHLRECLQTYAHVHTQLPHGPAVEMALWFHDAIYDVKGHSNEEQSAQWAVRELTQAGVLQRTVEQVHALVLATRHTALPVQADEQLLVDIDLSILGAAPERFAEYEQQIRAEYAFVPGWIFKRKRREILRSFLERPRIYSTDHFHATWEARARANLHKVAG